MTWASRIHSPSIIAMLYSMGISIHVPGECIGKGTKPYWYHNTAHYKEPCMISLHFPNLLTYTFR